MDSLYDAPELHRALVNLAREHVYLSGPETPEGPSRWLPCGGCDSVVAVPSRTAQGGTIVSTLCELCTASCPHSDCGLRVHEHEIVDGRPVCEPIE